MSWLGSWLGSEPNTPGDAADTSVSTLQALQQAVQASSTAGRPTSEGFELMAGAGALISFVNLPLGLLLELIGAAGSVRQDRKHLNSTYMPDSWLGRVSESREVSPEGLAFLAKRLADTGRVSVADALNWVALEEDLARKHAVAARKALPGAETLLARAQRECGALLEPSVLDRAWGAVTSSVKTLAGAAPQALKAITRR